MPTSLPAGIQADVQALWDYHRVDDEPDLTDVAIGLGSHDPSVAVHVATLYKAGAFPLIAFTGANAPTTVDEFPRGEAVHYREIAVGEGVPADVVLVEPAATNTAENFTFTRELLADAGVHPRTALIVCRPYQQRRARATAQQQWPDVEFRCSAVAQSLDQYLAAIGDPDRVVHMLVGDTQRLTVYAEAGFAAPVEIPEEVTAAYRRLVTAGYTDRLISAPSA